MKRTVSGPALALAILLAGGGAARAQATPEAEAAGAQVAHVIFQAISFESLIATSLSQSGGPLADLKARPEWDRYLAEALIEETRQDLPHFERLLGRELARDMTVEELKAGAAILSDPAMQAAMRAGADGGQAAGRPSRETERLAETPAGRRFLAAMDDLEAKMAPLEDEFVIEILPGAFRRFADKAEAGEAVRRAQAGASTVK